VVYFARRTSELPLDHLTYRKNFMGVKIID
jgi:hypothetical protein